MKKIRIEKHFMVTVVTEGELSDLIDFIPARLWSLENKGGRVVDVKCQIINEPNFPYKLKILTGDELRETLKKMDEPSGIGDIHCSIEMPSTAAALDEHYSLGVSKPAPLAETPEQFVKAVRNRTAEIMGDFIRKRNGQAEHVEANLVDIEACERIAAEAMAKKDL